MNEPRPVTGDEDREGGPVFISYATADRKDAMLVCNALERRGTDCWIASRDVQPGENYQEAIVRSLRAARTLVLVFSEAANNSDEIKKELSLASRYRIPVIALRMENVEPSDAFAYELSTRQWINAFDGWNDSIESLVGRINGFAGTAQSRRSSPITPRTRRPSWRAAMIGGGAVIALLGMVAVLWSSLRPSPAAAHSMVVRLSDFEALSAGLPPTMPEMVREEIIGAFGDDGVIRISTGLPEQGKGPAYLLGGTIRRDGDQIRVITRLTNERSGTSLWTDTFDYDAKQVSGVPRRIAVDAGNMVHCGLFAASTYHKPLPDPVMSDYMQFCQNSWWSQSFSNPEKALDAARKVVTSAPDFSWGWSAITVAAEQVVPRLDPGPHRDEVRRLGLQAADKALKLDPKNSEAFAQKSLLIERTDWAGQEQLLKRSIAARPLFCGCEHYLYGIMLMNVGRVADSVGEMRRSTEMLALDGISQLGLADALLMTGRPEEFSDHFLAATDLFRDPGTASDIASNNAPETGNYGAGIKALGDANLHISSAKRAALLEGFRAMANGDASAKSRAAQALIALPDGEADSLSVRLLGALGAHRAALQIAGKHVVLGDFAAASSLWYPSMRGTLSDPAFPALAQRLGLMKYWKATHTRPDVCSAKAPPSFCTMI